MAQYEGRTLWRAPKTFLTQFIFFVVMVVVALVFGLVVHQLKAAATTVWTDESNFKATAATDQGAHAAAQASTTSNPKANKNDAPYCTPAQYKLPTPLDVRGLPVGVTTMEDSLQQYTVYGNTADQRLQQLQQCAPAGEYAGAASYQITWQYAYSVRSDGLCEVMQPKIALHLAMILPRWQPGPSATSGEVSAWDAYIQALSTHEHGHYHISRQYAQAMLDGLNRLPAQSCSQIKTAADQLLETKLAQLSTAQSSYDATTNHGATQGAVL